MGPVTSTGGTWRPENQDSKISMEPGTQNIQVRFGIQGSKSEIWDWQSTLAFSCFLNLIHLTSLVTRLCIDLFLRLAYFMANI